MVVQTFNPQHWGGRMWRISEFEANLIYKVSSRTERVTGRNPVLGEREREEGRGERD